MHHVKYVKHKTIRKEIKMTWSSEYEDSLNLEISRCELAADIEREIVKPYTREIM